MKKTNVQMLCVLATLTACEIVLSRFCSISTWNMKIGFGFAPIALAAILYGPLPAAAVAGMADFLGATLFPIGPYFPGFTMTAALTGLTFGIFLYRRQSILRAAGAVLIVQLLLGLLVNSYWIHLISGAPYTALLATRLLQCLILIPVQFAGIVIIARSRSVITRAVGNVG